MNESSIKIDKSRFNIVWHDPKDLKPHPKNFRRHPAKQKTVLKAALAEEGWIDPIIFNKQTGRILDGHARVEEALAGGVEQIPVIEIDVDEETEKKIIARHDRIGALAEIDDLALTDLLGTMPPDETLDLGWDEFADLPTEEITEPEPEIKFREELLESHNYVVLFFTNEIDWLSAQTHFGVETVKNIHANGKSWSNGIGRVIDGADYLKRGGNNNGI